MIVRVRPCLNRISTWGLLLLCLFLMSFFHEMAHANEIEPKALACALIPKPISLQISGIMQISSFEYPEGLKQGPLYILSPIQPRFGQFVNQSRKRFKTDPREVTLASSVIPRNPSLFEALMIRQTSEPETGALYLNSFPSPALFNYLADKWNAQHPPSQQIFLRQYDSVKLTKSLRMLKEWADTGAVPMAVGELSNEPLVVAQSSISDRDVGESLYSHDVEAFHGTLCIPQGPIEYSRRLGRFWLEVRKLDKKFPELRYQSAVKAATLKYLNRIHMALHDIAELSENGLRSGFADEFRNITVQSTEDALEFYEQFKNDYPEIRRIWDAGFKGLEQSLPDSVLFAWEKEAVARSQGFSLSRSHLRR